MRDNRQKSMINKFQTGWRENNPTTTLQDLKATLESKPEDMLAEENLEMAKMDVQDIMDEKQKFEDYMDLVEDQEFKWGEERSEDDGDGGYALTNDEAYDAYKESEVEIMNSRQ